MKVELLYSMPATWWFLWSNNHGELVGSSNSTKYFCNDQTLILDEQDYQYWQTWKLNCKITNFKAHSAVRYALQLNWTERTRHYTLKGNLYIPFWFKFSQSGNPIMLLLLQFLKKDKWRLLRDNQACKGELCLFRTHRIVRWQPLVVNLHVPSPTYLLNLELAPPGTSWLE